MGVMNEATSTRAATALLCGPGRTDLVRAAIGLDQATSLSVTIDRVQHRTDGVSVGYDVRYGDGAPLADYLVASTAPPALAATGPARLRDGDLDVAVWRHPGDPELPGLAAACDLATVAGWLPGTVRLEMVTYRPLRRAVVRALGEHGVTGYLKVVRPRAADALERQHIATLAAGAPAVLGRPAPGVLVLADVAGPTLAEAISDGHAAPDLTEILAALDAIAPDAVHEAPVRTFAQDLPSQIDALAGVLAPEVLARLRRIATTVAAQVLATARRWPVVATHGDLHAANLVVATGAPGTFEPEGVTAPVTLVGLLDVDRVGPGHRVDDLACLLAHLSVTAALPPGGDAAHTGHRTVERWWAQVADPAPLAARTASVVLALTGVVEPARVPALLELAGAWSARATTPNRPIPLAGRFGTDSTTTTKESS